MISEANKASGPVVDVLVRESKGTKQKEHEFKLVVTSYVFLYSKAQNKADS